MLVPGWVDASGGIDASGPGEVLKQSGWQSVGEEDGSLKAGVLPASNLLDPQQKCYEGDNGVAVEALLRDALRDEVEAQVVGPPEQEEVSTCEHIETECQCWEQPDKDVIRGEEKPHEYVGKDVPDSRHVAIRVVFQSVDTPEDQRRHQEGNVSVVDGGELDQVGHARPDQSVTLATLLDSRVASC